MPRLRRSVCSGPGIRRRKAGKGFTYIDACGEPVSDVATLERIRALAIPPAWTDVWICPFPNGHIQAMGTDAKGRRQYRYHDAWRVQRDREKFDHMIEFAQALPGLRRVCCEHLAADDLNRERVLACATRLLDVGFFRIGTEGYAEENQSFGLATIRKDHVRLRAGAVEFDYVAKSGKQRLHALVDPDVYEVLHALKRRRGGSPELLAFRAGGRWVDVRSSDINDFIKTTTGGEFTAKDFRTWNATVLMAVALAVSAAVTSPTGQKRAIARGYQEVAGYLGNTPAVSRASYVDPRVVDRFLNGETVAGALQRLGAGVAFGQLGTQGEVEAAVLDLLADGDVASVAA